MLVDGDVWRAASASGPAVFDCRQAGCTPAFRAAVSCAGRSGRSPHAGTVDYLCADRREHVLDLGRRARHFIHVREGDVIPVDGVRAAEHPHTLRDLAKLDVLGNGRELRHICEVCEPLARPLRAQRDEGTRTRCSSCAHMHTPRARASGCVGAREASFSAGEKRTMFLGALKSGGVSSCLSPSRMLKPAARYPAKSAESSMSALASASSWLLSSRKDAS